MYAIWKCSKMAIAMAMAVMFISCGNGIVDSTAPSSSDTMPLQLDTHIRDNLIRHYTNHASKPPVDRPRPANTYHFDFLEQSRTITPGGQGLVQGAFLFSVNNNVPRQGVINVFYTFEDGLWQPTGGFKVQEQPVEAVTLNAQIRNSATEEPMDQVEVFARRVEDNLRTSRRVRTDAQGIAQMEVLAGNFQILVTHPEFLATTTPTILAAQPQIQIEAIHLAPISKRDRLP